MDIDFTDLQKRGLIKTKPLPEKTFQMKGDVLDLSATSPSMATPATTQTPSNPFDFLESFASASQPPTTSSSSADLTSVHEKLISLQTSVDKLVTTMDNMFYRMGELEQRLRTQQR